MFKPIRITPTNSAAIQDLLHEVNGRAKEHTFTTYWHVQNAVDSVQQRLDELLPKVAQVGAAAWICSGGFGAKSYRGKRIATQIRIERRPTGWFLTDVMGGALYQEGGRADLILTPTQDLAAKAKLAATYRVFMSA